MALSSQHDKIDDIPEPYRPLYTEKGGKWELTGISGVKGQAEFERIQQSLKAEREAHKATQGKLDVWGELDHAKVQADLDRIPALEAAGKGTLDQAKIDELVGRQVEGTLKSKMAPVERELGTLRKQAELKDARIRELEGEKAIRTIHDVTRKAMTAAKVLPDVEEDVLMHAERIFEVAEDGRVVSKDKVGVTPGIEPGAWLAEVKDRKAYWFPESKGSGARGSGGGGGGFAQNPWSHAHWNVTAQGAFVKQHGMERAKAAAAAAGAVIGGGRPIAPK